MEKVLLKIDKNGSKHWQGPVQCDRCGGSGTYYIGTHNGQLIPAHPDAGVCYKCHGSGVVLGKWIERTPEYQAKLDAKRQSKIDARIAEMAEKERLAEEARKAREAEIKALKAISQYVGEIGQKIQMKVTYIGYGSWEQAKYIGYGSQTMYAHNFKDADGNKLVWKTTSFPEVLWNAEAEIEVLLTATIKDHSEYKDEKQTLLTRCKIQEV